MNRKNKQLAASALALSMLVSGTFAWQSFSQRITNETAGFDADQGTRLHNYFDGSNVDVFVENYSTVESGVQAYTRVKVLEYMEIGEGAGALDGSNSSATLVRGDVQNYIAPSITDKTTWDTYLHQDNDGATSGEIRDYLTVNYGDENNSNGGSTVYMPTFNKDFDNDTAEINGTLLGSGSDRFDSSTYYDNYVSYTAGQSITEMATYSADALAVQGLGTTQLEETHVAANTISASVITMDEWISDQKSGDFWVYDTDGWAYWANGIAPQTATSLLIDSISKTKTPDEDWYYGLHVINDSATADAWLEQIMMDGGQPISDNAILLLSEMGIEAPELEVSGVTILTPAGGIPSETYTQTTVGGSIVLGGTVSNNYGTEKYQDLNWHIEEVSTASFLVDLITSGNDSGLTDEQINATLVDGTFTPVAAMKGYSYLVTAESKVDTDQTASIVLTVIDDTVEEGVTINSVEILTTTGAAPSAAYRETSIGSTVGLSAAVYTSAGTDEYQNVTWSISGTLGSLTQTQLNASLVGGVFTPIDGMAGRTYTIKATSMFDTTKSASTTVTVIDNTPVVSLEIASVAIRNANGGVVADSAKELFVGDSTTLTASVYHNMTATDYQNVTWSIKAETGDLLSSVVSSTLVNGIFTPVTGMEGNTYTVTATSAFDTSKSDSITFTVKKAIEDLKEEIEEEEGEKLEIQKVYIRNSAGYIPTEGQKETTVGSDVKLTAEVATNFGNKDYQDVTWAITANSGTLTAGVVNATLVNGVFTPVTGMEGHTYTVTARSLYDTSVVSDEIVLTVGTVTEIIESAQITTTEAGIPNVAYKTTTVGGSITLMARVYTNLGYKEYQDMVWTIKEKGQNTSSSIINATMANGTFSPISGMEGKEYTVTATSKQDSNKSDSIDLIVEDREITGFSFKRSDTSVPTGIYMTPALGESREFTMQVDGNYDDVEQHDIDYWTYAVSEYIPTQYQISGEYSSLSTEEIQKALSVDKKNNTVTFTAIEGMEEYTFRVWAYGPDFDSSVEYPDNYGGIEPDGSTNVKGKNYEYMTFTIYEQASDYSDASVEIKLSDEYTGVTEVKQGGYIAFAYIVENLNLEGVTWYAEGNDSPSTRAQAAGYLENAGGGLYVAADETVGNTLTVYAVSNENSDIVSNRISVKVSAMDEDAIIVEVPGALGVAVAGTESLLKIDDQEYYVLTVDETGKEALLWSAGMIDLPEGVYIGSNTYNSYFHNRLTKSTLWEESYIRTVAIPAWLEEYAPTVAAVSLEKELVTDAFYTVAGQEVGNGSRADEITNDKVFILSQGEFIKYVGLGSAQATNTQFIYWTRSAVNTAAVRCINGAGTAMAVTSEWNSHDRGIRAAFWIGL